MKGVLVTVLTISMVMESAHYYRPTCRAACRGSEGICENSTIMGD